MASSRWCDEPVATPMARMPARFADTPVLAKPYRRHDIQAALEQLQAAQ